MPLMKLTKKSREMGPQTFERATRRLPEELLGAELDYLRFRDWYIDMVGAREQYEEALAQAKKSNNQENIEYYKAKLNTICGHLTDARDRVKHAGSETWNECFYQLAYRMLSPEARKIIEEETDRFMGRPKHELRA